jgi:hypothetical protein
MILKVTTAHMAHERGVFKVIRRRLPGGVKKWPELRANSPVPVFFSRYGNDKLSCRKISQIVLFA